VNSDDTADDAEYLVLLDDSRAAATLDDLRAAGHVAQVASPRLVLLTTDRHRSTELREHAGVVGVFADALPSEMTAGLNESEQLFADAWATRRNAASSKRRSGEGLDWDDERFLPPDPPPP
jgi:hypothetical protein